MVDNRVCLPDFTERAQREGFGGTTPLLDITQRQWSMGRQPLLLNAPPDTLLVAFVFSSMSHRPRGTALDSAMLVNESMTLHPKGHGSTPADVIVLHIRRRAVTEVLASAGIEIAGLSDRCVGSDTWLDGLASTLRRELVDALPGSDVVLQAIAVQIILHFARLPRDATERRPCARGKHLGGLAAWQRRRVVDHMRANLAETQRLRELAAIVGLSETHFCRAFGQSMGEPPFALLRRLRIERAKELLIEGESPMAEVALEVGYGNQSSFGVAFREATGASPRAWQRRHGGGPRPSKVIETPELRH
ncbi:MAG: AraC family transcriptional regulator [Pseudomonadota bacterium]